MRSFLLILGILMITFAPLAGASISAPPLEDSFDSEKNLDLFDFTSPEALLCDSLDDFTISLVTQAPGDEIYIWFGHAGLMLSAYGDDIMYDWGVFSFSPGFYSDFIFGRLFYRMVPSWASSSIQRAVSEDRSVKILTLPLDRAAKQGVIDFLNYNSLSENRTYLYHYYYDNCATRIRDIVNRATDGDFRAWAEGIDTDLSFRELSTWYMRRSNLISFTLNFLQSSVIDKDVSLYEACFLPDVLMCALETYYNLESEVVYEGSPEQTGESHLVISSLVAGLIFAVLLYSFWHVNRKAYALVSTIFYLYLAVISSVLLFMMLFTNHDVTFGNENIIFVNPLILIPLIESIIMIFHKKTHWMLSRSVFRILTVLSLCALALKGLFPQTFCQENLYVFSLVLPVYIAMSLRKE